MMTGIGKCKESYEEGFNDCKEEVLKEIEMLLDFYTIGEIYEWNAVNDCKKGVQRILSGLD